MDKQERMDAAFRCFCEFLDGEGLQYQAETNEGEDKRILLGFSGDALPLRAVFAFEVAASRIYVGSLLPFAATAETADELMMAVLRVNQIVAVGTFCVNDENEVTFESNEILTGVGSISTDYPARVIGSTFAALEGYGGQLAAVARGESGAADIKFMGEEEGI